MTEGLTIRELETHGELRACVELQEAVWGRGFSERAPVSILKIARRLGGIVAGALDGDDVLQGFVFGLTGVEKGRVVHWSDMLAVRTELRDRGVGSALKRFQRERCLDRGVTRMYWTYDPLEARNGRVNLGKLGAISREYVRDMYGPSDSPLHRGLGTDRLVVLWLLDSPRVEARLAGREAPPTVDDVGDVARAFEVTREDGVRGTTGRPIPRPSSEPESPAPRGSPRLVPVPARIQDVKQADPGAATAWRHAVRHAVEAGLAAGLEVTELIRGGADDVCHLLMEPRTVDAGAAGSMGGARGRPTTGGEE